MFFELDTSLLDAAQALCIALPAAGLPVFLARFGGRGWSLVAPLSVVATVAAITLAAESAEVLTWIAFLLVPPGCALALGWAAHGARPWLAVLVVPMLAAAMAAPDDPLGRLGRLALIVGSCVTVGRLLAGAAPLALLKAGVYAMAAIDAVFIFGDFFGEQNAQFNAATPAADLPRLQVAELGDVSTDYGDFFVAGLVGGILAAEGRRQAAAAVAAFVVAQAFNQLFLVVDSLPGTVPPALVLLAFGRRSAKPGRVPGVLRREALRAIGTGRAGSLIPIIAAATLFAAAGFPGGAEAAELEARGSVEQVHVTGANPGQRVALLHRREVVKAQRASELGGAVFRRVKPRGRYRVRAAGETTRRLRVLTDRPRPPRPRLYDQSLPAGGYGYLRTRDGTKLAVNVQLPGPPGNGPYPTVVEYSGYGYANPAGPESGIAPIALLLGYAVVDVNMRGTGCSGGAFDYFEPLQSLDGYDVVEAVARQPWVMHDKVGMMGISYGGISQLFVAATRPPSLAAIAPLSVIDDSATTLYPGGILNTGFALGWAQDRVDDAKPATATTGQPWAWERIQGGDETCAENQDLHPEAVDLIAKVRANRYYRPRVADPVTPAKFVDEIEVPVFLACQWQDEQTGGHCSALARRFTGTDRKWFTFTNGTHSDSLDPETFNRWFDFLELYVAKRRPVLSQQVKNLAPVLYSTLMGVPGVTLPPDPIQAEPDYESALEAFEDVQRVRILFENGGGGDPGKPVPSFERSFDAFPPAAAEARSWYLAGDGTLTDEPAARGANRFTWDPEARPPTNFTGDTGSGPGGLWTATPDYDWTQSAPGRALAYVSSALASDTAVIGGGALQLWVRSSARNVDLQATVSEVRPDGNETFVQGGWLRTGARRLDPARSTLLEPVPSFRRRDEQTLPKNRWVKVTLPLYYQGHVYRAGSRIRVTVSAPGGDQPIWAFAEARPSGTPWVAVAHARQRYRSRLILPVVDGVGAPQALPPCPGLRGQPCRPYVPYSNPPFPAPGS